MQTAEAEDCITIPVWVFEPLGVPVPYYMYRRVRYSCTVQSELEQIQFT